MTKSPKKPTSKHRTAAEPSAEAFVPNRLPTIPNLICGTRLVGSFVLVGIAWFDYSELFLWVFLLLAVSDWIDGKLAILLNQRSVFGARLDSWADAALYAALLVGAVMMYGETLACRNRLAHSAPCRLCDFDRRRLLEISTLAKLSHACRQDRMVLDLNRGNWSVYRLVALAAADRAGICHPYQPRSFGHNRHIAELAHKCRIDLSRLAA